MLILTFLGAIYSLLVALVILLKNRQSVVNRWLFVFLVATCAWVLATNLLGVYWSGPGVVPLQLPFALALFLGLAALRFVYALRAEPLGVAEKWVEPGVFAVAVGLTFSPFVISGGYFDAANGAIVGLERAFAYPVIILIILYFLLKSLVVVWRTRQHTIGQRRTQLGLVLFGMAAGTVVGLVTNVLLPNVTHSVASSQFSFTALLLWSTTLSYAILRHRFMDIRLAVVRALAYILSFLVVIVAYSTVVFAVSIMFFGGSGQMSLPLQAFNIAAAMTIAFTLNPLQHFFSKVTTEIFYQDAPNMQEVIDHLGTLMVREVDVVKLLKKSMQLLATAVKPTGIEVVLLKEHQPVRTVRVGTAIRHDSSVIEVVRQKYPGLLVTDELADHASTYHALREAGVAIVAPLVTSNATIGYVLIGYKASGDAFTQQDIDLVHIFGDELAVAAQNALRFEEISHFNETLKAEVDEATSQLRESNRKLHKLDEAKDEFMSMASHQLRTPLTSVKGYLSMVLEGDAGKITDDQKKLLEEAYSSSQRMVYLIGDFLNVSRLQTGKFTLEPAQVNLAELVGEEVDQLQATAARRGIRLTYHAPSSFPDVTMDDGKMRQVVMNFIDNAVYYSRANSNVLIEVLADGRDMTFAVHDTGIGVPAAERHHLFTKFFRASNARKVRPDGTGIGLYMAKKVITAHHGSIIFETKENKGSTFGFKLPLKY